MDNLFFRSHDVNIENVYSLSRAMEHAQYRDDMSNEHLLFHASSVQNFVGILSRGLLLPRIVVDDYGGKRTDPGMLGNGIYFADAARYVQQSMYGRGHCNNCVRAIYNLKFCCARDTACCFVIISPAFICKDEVTGLQYICIPVFFVAPV